MMLLGIAVALLNGCGTTVYKTDLEIYCPPIRQYAPEFNNKLADEIDVIPNQGSAIETVVTDYMVLRDKLSACHKEQEKRDG
jgi:hypothetical protein